jgi:hypothetical protein
MQMRSIGKEPSAQDAIVAKGLDFGNLTLDSRTALGGQLPIRAGSGSGSGSGTGSGSGGSGTGSGSGSGTGCGTVV